MWLESGMEDRIEGKFEQDSSGRLVANEQTPFLPDDIQLGSDESGATWSMSTHTSPDFCPILGAPPEEIECIPEIDRTCLVMEEEETMVKGWPGVCGTSEQKHVVIESHAGTGRKSFLSANGGSSTVKEHKDFLRGTGIDKQTPFEKSPSVTILRVSDQHGKSFSRRTHFIPHNRQDCKEKPFVCDLCDARFSKKCKVTDHRRTHTGERPYSCDACGARFSNRGGLFKHKKTHSGARPHACEVCGVRFAQSSYLVRHRRTHSGEKPFPCDACAARFPDNASLTRHKRTHSGERPYVCDVCNTTFSRSNYLVLHKRTHSGEKPYACDMCSACFSQKNNLARHKKMHLGNKSCP